MMLRMFALALLLLTACEDNGSAPAPQPPGTQPATEWEQGPPCINDSGSCGVPLHPTRTAEGVVIDVPPEPSHVNYLTRSTGSLAGKSHIRIRFRVEGGPIRATKPRGEVWDGKLWLYFERRGNNFTGGPEQNWYRWWAEASETRLHAGEYEITARFDDLWTGVSYGANVCGFDPSNDPVDEQGNCRGPGMFQAARANAARVGFTFGGGDGKGHGAHGPGRIVVTEFAVE